MTGGAKVVFRLNPGPKFSMTRLLEIPPTPRAASRESDPDETASKGGLLSMPPSRMMDPLPNCFSICDTARSRARLFSVLSSAINVLSSPMSSASNQKQFVADDSIELVRAGRILGKAAHAFAVAAFTRIQGLRRFKTFLGFSEPVHLQAQQSELVMSFTKLRIQFRGLLQMADGAHILSRAVVKRADQKMHRRAGLQFECGVEMFDGLLSLPDRGEQRSKRCVRSEERRVGKE